MLTSARHDRPEQQPLAEPTVGSKPSRLNELITWPGTLRRSGLKTDKVSANLRESPSPSIAGRAMMSAL